MCRRCIIKGRAVGKSTEVGDDYNESLKAVLEHDKCVAILEVDGRKVAAVNLTKAQVTEIRRGMYPDVSMSCFIPGKTVKEIQLAGAYLASVKQESDDVVKGEEVDVQFERAVPVGMKMVTDIHRRVKENTDPKNRPPLELTSRQSLGKVAKDPVPPGPLQPIYKIGVDYPVAWEDQEGNVYGREGKLILAAPTLVGDTPMKTVTKISIEDGELKTEGEPVCTCGEDDDDGLSLPHKTWCPRAGE